MLRLVAKYKNVFYFATNCRITIYIYIYISDLLPILLQSQEDKSLTSYQCLDLASEFHLSQSTYEINKRFGVAQYKKINLHVYQVLSK
jgi:hypothetical protein